MSEHHPVVEVGIAELRAALDAGRTTSVALVRAYLDRIEAYDRLGPRLSSVVELDPRALAEARAADERRSVGSVLGPLDGIPYTAKDSFMVAGMTVAAGSPAFAQLVALLLYGRYREDPEAFAPLYLEFLGRGGSASPAELLEPFDLDLHSTDTWRAAFAQLDALRETAENLSAAARG